MRQVVVRYGIPMAAYSDRHSIFWQTKDKHLTVQEQLEGRRQLTQFGRLLEELGVVHEGFDGSVAVYRDGACLVRELLVDPPSAYRVHNHSAAPAEPPQTKPPKAPSLPSQPPRPPKPTLSNSPWKLARHNSFLNRRPASGQNH